jgi:hypothetical protein
VKSKVITKEEKGRRDLPKKRRRKEEKRRGGGYTEQCGRELGAAL